MKTKSVFIAYSAVIAAAYAVLTLISGALGLGYWSIQLRISEALTILPLFTPAAIPGLTVGCIIANIFSFNPIDMLVGTCGTLLAAILTRATRHITFKGLPLLSIFWPVIINAVFVGAELAVLYSPAATMLSAFAVSALQVGAGQLVACYGLGLPLYFAIQRKNIFN